jgi:osmotically inducible lipoprotein OsmB
MKTILTTITLAVSLTACNSYNPNDRAIAGGLIGAGTGAVVGGIATRNAGGALAGAVIGGAGGAIIGAATTPDRGYRRYNRGYNRRGCRGYDAYGEPVRYAC